VIELLGPYSAWTRDRAGLIGLVHDLTRSALTTARRIQLTIVICWISLRQPTHIRVVLRYQHQVPRTGHLAPRGTHVFYDYGPMVPDPDAIYRMYVDSISLSLESRNRGPRTHKAHRRAQRLQ